MPRTSRRLARRTSRQPRRRGSSARRTSRVRPNISAQSLPGSPPSGEHTVGDWDWWLRQAFPVGVPVKTKRLMSFFPEDQRYSEYSDWAPEGWAHLPRGARASVTGEPKYTGNGWKVPVEIVDVRDEHGYVIDDLIGKRGWIAVDIEDGEFWGLEPLEDQWPQSSRRTSRHQLPRSQRSWMKPNPAPPYPRRPPGTSMFDLQPSYARKIRDWMEKTFPPGTPVAFTKDASYYGGITIPAGARAEVVGYVAAGKSVSEDPERVWVRVVDARDHSGIQISLVIGQVVGASADGIRPLVDHWAHAPRRTSRHALPRSQRSWMKPNRRTSRNPAPPYPRRPPDVTWWTLPEQYVQKIRTWLNRTYPPGTPISTTRDIPYYGGVRIPLGARGKVIGPVDGYPERLYVRIVDARDESGFRISEVVGEVVGMSPGDMKPLVDHWSSQRRTSRRQVPNPIPLPPRDRYAPRQTPDYLEWVARAFSPGTPVRFTKPHVTYSEGGKLLDISPGSEGSIVDSAHHPETVHVWLEASDTHPYPCIAAIDTEFEAIEDILSPMRDNWEVSGDAPTERHQSFLRMKENRTTVRDWRTGEQQGYAARKGAPLMDARVGTTVTDGKLSRSTAGLRVGVITDVDRPAPGDVRVRWKGEAAGVHKRRSLYRVEYDMAANPSYQWETLADVEGSNANDSYASLHAGMQGWNPNEWETTGLASDDSGVELGEDEVALIRQQHQFRLRRNPDRKRLGLEVGDTLELERHPVYDHPGVSPAYKVTKRKVKSIEPLDGGGAFLKLVGARQPLGGGRYIDKLYRLGGSEERGWWLSSSDPPSRYLVLSVVKKKRR